MIVVSSSVSLASFLLQSFFRKTSKTETGKISTYLHINVCLQSLKLDCTVKEDKQPLEILSQHDLRER